jgi:hypothetical protein
MSKNDSWFARNVWSGDDKKEESGSIEPPDFSKGKVNKVQPPNFVNAAPAAAQTTYTPTVAVSNEEIQKYREHIKEVMRGANQEGPDYFEFSEAIERNASLNLQPAVSFVVSFNSLIPLGLTKEKLVQTAQFYISKLQEELTNFKSDREERRQKDVLGKQTEIKSLETDNNRITQEIQKLSEKMNQNSLRIAQLNEEKTQAEQKLLTSTSNMEKAITEEVARINNDIATIQQVIK